MSDSRDSFTVEPMSKMRYVYIDFLHLSHQKHLVSGLIEVDVTLPRRFIQQHKERTGERLSFTAFIAACIGRAVDEHKVMHAYRNWRDQLVMFDEVDITTMVEIQAGDEKLPIPHIVRAANKRTFRDIHDEIRALQAERRRQRRNPYQSAVRFYPWLPRFLRRWIIGAMLRSPHRVKEQFGTVGLTAVGMFGQGGGWAITEPVSTLGVAVGGIAEKPGEVDGRIEIREYLSLTLTFDHDIVDGAPAARFAKRLRELLEMGYGLREEL